MADIISVDCSTEEVTLETFTSAQQTQFQRDQQAAASLLQILLNNTQQIATNAAPLRQNLVPIAQLLIGAPTPWPTQAQIQAVQNGTATNAQAQAVLAGVLRAFGHLLLVLSAGGPIS